MPFVGETRVLQWPDGALTRLHSFGCVGGYPVVHRPCAWEVDLLRVCLLMGCMDGEWSLHGACGDRTSLSTASASFRNSFLLGSGMRQQV